MNIIAHKTAISTVARVSESLRTFDPKLYDLIQAERSHQAQCISLIASENYTPKYCSDALSSCLSMKYSEGYPKDRYYAGNLFIDQVESLCQERALKAFGLHPSVWGVNVQALSGSPANFAVYTALLSPRDRILYLNLPHGGHLSHGFGSEAKPVSATGKYFDCQSYGLDAVSELINYDEIEQMAQEFKPKLIIAGYSAYSRLLDYKRFRSIADKVGAYLLGDIAHIAGPMSAKLIPSAFDHCHVVTTTTHKTLRGPRGALIFSRKPLNQKIDKAVFPGCQGGPHNHTIAAIAAAMKACTEPEFKVYQSNVLNNAQTLANTVAKRGIRVVSAGTDNHLILIDLNNRNISGNQAESALESCNIITNKNSTTRDTKPKYPRGLRMGTPAMTTRGMGTAAFNDVGNIVCDVIDITSKRYRGEKNMEKFRQSCQDDRDLRKISEHVKEMVAKYPCVKSEIWRD